MVAVAWHVVDGPVLVGRVELERLPRPVPERACRAVDLELQPARHRHPWVVPVERERRLVDEQRTDGPALEGERGDTGVLHAVDASHERAGQPVDLDDPAPQEPGHPVDQVDCVVHELAAA